MKDSKATIRTLERLYVKEECVAEYRRHHEAVWPELEKLYLDNGVLAISCFMDGNELVVLYECDAEVYARKRSVIAESPVEIRWKQLMATFFDNTRPRTLYEEVYRLEA